MKAVRNAIYAVLLIAFAVGEAPAAELGKFGDCSERSVDPGPLTFPRCGDEQTAACFFEHGLAASRGVRWCRQQTLVGADLAGLAWLLGNKVKAKRLADHVVNKVYAISNGQTRVMAMYQTAVRFGFYGMGTYAQDMVLRLPPLMEASALAALAQRRSYQCDQRALEPLLAHIEAILRNNGSTHKNRLWAHVSVTFPYFFMGRVDDAVRHAQAARSLFERLSPSVQESKRWALVVALAGAGLVSEAEREVVRIDDPADKAEVHAYIADIFAFYNERKAALRAISSAELFSGQTDNKDVSLNGLGALHAARLRLGILPDLDRIDDPYVRTSIYVRLGRVLLDMQNNVGPGRCR